MASIWGQSPGRPEAKLVGGMNVETATEVFRQLVLSWDKGPKKAEGCFAWLYASEADALAHRASVMLHLEFLSPPSKPGPGGIYRKAKA
jgi:hypothetical protein